MAKMELNKRGYKDIVSDLSEFDKKRLEYAKNKGAQYFTMHRNKFTDKPFIGMFYCKMKGSQAAEKYVYNIFLESVCGWMPSQIISKKRLEKYLIEIED